MRRPNGTGTVVKLSGKRRKPYAARICTGRTISNNGKVIPKYEYLSYFATAREAQDYLDRYNGTDEMIEKLKLSSKKDNPTFSKVYEELLDYLESRPKTLSDSAYKSLSAAYTNLKPLHTIKFKNIDYELLQTAISKNKSKSRSSLNNIRNLLRKMYNLGLKKKYVDEDLSKLCDYDFTETHVEIHTTFTKEEIKKIYNDAPSPSRDMLLILLYTGIRVQELLILETANVHLDEQYFITGVKTDAGKSRIIPIHNDILPIINAHFNPNKYYFWDVQGSQRIYQTVRWRFNRYMQQLDMKHLPHDTRHTAATLMNESGMNEMHMKLILGHRLDDLTQRVYIHVKPADLVTSMNQVTYL